MRHHHQRQQVRPRVEPEKRIRHRERELKGDHLRPALRLQIRERLELLRRTHADPRTGEPGHLQTAVLPWGGVCAIPQFINTYDTDDSRYQDNYIKGQQYTAEGDSIYGTMGDFTGKPLSYRNYLPGVDISDEVDGFRLGKFEIAMGATNRLSNDWPLFRYADILLMKAESLLRTGHADDAAVIVTQVRQRDFKTNPAKATVTGAQLLGGSSYDYGLRNHLTTTTEGGGDVQYGRMLDELGWEFCQEARRRTDMVRFGVFTKNPGSPTPPTATTGPYIPYPAPRSPKTRTSPKTPATPTNSIHQKTTI
ncbi:RagB/SusD family nutrient uptake outer membrane protein [Puia sp. P3]|uniref:RagB/SusD family nutrient uptake outer membrane protein n=1 Tax=Puia sp. P3 TaxID=3423952 RepID=UPI003D665778